MSGIAGLYHLDQTPVQPDNLQRMLDALAHRGADGHGLWYNGYIGFVHQLLWATETSCFEKLPLLSEDGQLVITADARIDNRDELLNTLRYLNHNKPGECATESALILAAYQQWGEDCPQRLIGDFAFAIWDAREKKLFCARDALGVKPFYYAHNSRQFAFASEIKPLLCLPGVTRRVNELRVAYHLIRRIEDHTMTFYADIVRLPAASTLVVQQNGLRVQRYWSPEIIPNIRLASDEAYAEAFREVFIQAVRSHLRSAFPIGSFLSGGLDSSSIACAAQKLLHPRSLHTYSAIFPGLSQKDRAKIDERQHIQVAHATGNFTAHFVEADAISPLVDLDRVIWHEDEAFFAPNLYMHWSIYKQANLDGVRVLLDGLGGDSVVSHGWERLPELLRSLRWRTLVREVTAYKKNVGLPLSRRGLIMRIAVAQLVPPALGPLWRRVRSESIHEPWDNVPMRQDFMKRVQIKEHLHAADPPKQFRSARRTHEGDILSPMYPSMFELVDKAAAAFSIEARYPFFDRRVIEFCLAVPADQKFSQGWTRAILRRAMQGILPPEIQWRSNKGNLSVNVQRALLEKEAPTLESMLEWAGDFVSPYVDMDALKNAYRRYTENPLSSDEDLFAVYSVLVLATWLKFNHT